MAKMEFGGNQKADQNSTDTTPAVSAENEKTPETTPIVAWGGESSSRTNTSGMTAEEITDSNKIKVTVADYKTPLVILFGPPACGKTMTLVRLSRYLRSKLGGYKVEPIPSFRPQYDKHYQDMCGNFNTNMSSDNAAESTSKINFMLVRVSYKGKPLCQILEAPGEDYFNPENPTAMFPNYVNAIISSRNRKIWAIMVEPADVTNSRMGTEPRRLYVDKVKSLKTKISQGDKVMFVFNKIDATNFVVSPGVIQYGEAKQHIDYLYPGIFEPFTNVNPITKLWKPYNFDFVAIQTGTYPKANDGTVLFQEGPDVYPKKLWQFIMKRVRG